ncbi:beta-galactosidase [Lachnospiraceae bacterium 62-35]
MWLGVDYYPEQWKASMMEEDMDNILELGCNIIRIGEFSWHRMEQREGAYDFSFFDQVIEKAKRKGLRILMGTPTAAIPAWLAKKHPEILSEFEDGTRRSFGGRHVHCLNSPVMYQYTERIVRALAEHYKGEKAIVAWQVDNEIGHEGSDLCYCPRCHRAFQEFLKEKFKGDIERLNEIYGTAFWSQEYNDFDEIPLPSATITTHNPALRLDWERFRSKAARDFIEFQVRLLREILEDGVILHDFPGGGLAKHCDYSQAAKSLDFAAYNNYPVWGGQKEPLPPHEIAFGLDYIRGLKQQNFWITEAIMGAQGHDVTGFLPRPGQAKMWSYQGVARGCSAMLYFRYRGAIKGAEQFCYGILDADNQKRRKFYEVQSFFQDIVQYEKMLETPVESQAALVYDYDSLAAFRIQRQSILLDCENEMKKLYKPFYDRNIMVDVIPKEADLSPYKVLILSQMIIMKEEFLEKIKAFAENGGIVVMTFRSSVKDEDNNLVLDSVLPVGCSEFAGLYVEETESLQDIEAFPLIGQGSYEGEKGMGGIFRDMLVPEGADVLYSYGDSFYTKYAAVTKNHWGKGEVYYLGCSLDENTLGRITSDILIRAGIPAIPSKEGVEIIRRGGGKEELWFFINHNAHQVQAGEMKLEPFQCRILKKYSDSFLFATNLSSKSENKL